MENNIEQSNARPARRGIILVFIVVLLVLLAIMGVAFLTTARADRASITSRGAAPDAPMESVLKDRTVLNESFNTIKDEVMYRLLRDLFNYAQSPTVDIHAALPASQYRALGGNGTYINKDAFGASDPHLASTLPVARLAGGKYVQWQRISSPLKYAGTASDVGPFTSVPRFYDPRTFLDTSADYDLTGTPDIFVSGVGVRVPDTAFGDFDTTTARSRTYPAFILPAFNNSDGTHRFIAGDADGDGQADSGLAPIKLNNGAAYPDDDIDAYTDPRNPGVVYFYSYRVVDNSSKVNVFTANSVKGDFTISNQSPAVPVSFSIKIQANDPDRPNMGFSRSNVGLVELMRGWLSAMGTYPINNEIYRLYNYRVRNVAGDSATYTTWDNTNNYPRNSQLDEELASGAGTNFKMGPTGSNTQHLTMGDALEYGINRRLGLEGYAFSSGAVFGAYSTEDARGLSYRGGGFLNPIYDATTIEQTLKESAYWTAINFAPTRSEQFGFIPPTHDDTSSLNPDQTPGNVINWFDWVYNFQPPAGWLPSNNWGLDSAPGTSDFAGVNQYRFNGTNFHRSIRSLLTGVSGVMATAPLRGGGPDYDVLRSNSGYTDMPSYDEIGFTKASASTSDFGELWRAFWSIMVDPNSGTGTANPNFPIRSVRHPTTGLTPTMFQISERSGAINTFRTTAAGNSDVESARMAILRSAIAALNTIDLRDPDDDLSWAEVKLDRGPNGLPSSTITAHVAGQEKQPYITGVAVRTNSVAANRAIVVELYNPYPTSIRLECFGLVVMNRSAGQLTPVGPVTYFNTNDVLLAGEVKTVKYSGAAMPAAIDPVGSSNITGASNVNNLVNAVTGGEIYLVRKAKANQTVGASDSLNVSPTDATGVAALFPVDYADLRALSAQINNDKMFYYLRSKSDWKFTYGGNWSIGQALQELTGAQTAQLGVAVDQTTINPVPVIQLQNFTVDSTAYPSARFPFGSPLARDGDLLTIPFIGNYLIRNGTIGSSTILEMNPITADAYMSDQSPNGKQIGRFIPVTGADDYSWTQVLPEVISAHQAPNAMNTPDVPVEYIPQTTTVRSSGTPLLLLSRDSANLPMYAQLPGVYTSSGTGPFAPNKLDGLDPNGLIQGRININTAPDLIRRLLPWRVDPATGFVNPADYTTFIQPIVASSNFDSIYQIALPAITPNDTKSGDLSVGALSVQVPVSSANASKDFEQQYLNQIRLSNLASTRSDSYTVYICVQAWRTNGTSASQNNNPARLLAERRGAYLVNRGVVTPLTGDLKTLLRKGVTTIEEE